MISGENNCEVEGDDK